MSSAPNQNERKFYMQDRRQFVGNAMLWWAEETRREAP